MDGDADIASVAAVMGHPARGTMLVALLGGRALPASELAQGHRRLARRPLTRSCLDWSERRPHLAGALGAAVLDALLEQRWLTRRPGGRALMVTAAGQHGFHAALGRDVA
jgi:hypothetical protein